MFFFRIQHTIRPLTRGFRTSTCNQYTWAPSITTLIPERLRSSDFIDLSNKTAKTINSVLKSGGVSAGQMVYSLTGGRQRFPEGTQGFLYCYHDPRLPSRTGEIRFRVTETSDPASFKNGFDLLRLDGELPWSIPLLQSQSPFRELAIQEGLIDSRTTVSIRRNRMMPLSFLEQPFVLNLEQTPRIAILTPREVLKTPRLQILFPNSHQSGSSFKGKLLVSFEEASRDEPGVNSTSIVMRALKIIEPIEPLEDAIEHHPIPTAGTLLKYASRGQIRTREFESPYLRLLPSIKSPTPPLSHGLEHFTSKTRKTFFAARVRTISTLDTRLLQPSDFIVLSNRKIVLIRVHVGAQKPVVVRYTQSGGLLPFPPDTQGFLYMHINPHLPLLSRQIRFRITASNDPAQFENGTDLLSRDQPWNLDAIQIAHSALLKDHLRHSGHAEYVQALSSLPNNRRKSRRALYYLEQPFVMNMSCKEYTLSIILSDDIRTFQFSSMFLDRRNSERIAPYTGRIVLRFERSSLQEHAGGNFVVFRVLKILDPIKPVDPSYDMHVPVPHVGSLLVNTKTRSILSYGLNQRRNKSVCNLKYLPSIPDVKPDLESFC
ncbi:hypothetical protein E4T56_gene3648 [Termitomyces sp. T112]|nr:hypothetical protein E4T56_gene3648 [Termitomyces sp. T112]